MASLSTILLMTMMFVALQGGAKAFVFSKSALRMQSTDSQKKKLLVLGGTGFLGQTICKRAVVEGYAVTSLSRRGVIRENKTPSNTIIDYRKGDAREMDTITSILNEGGYTGRLYMLKDGFLNV
jgi:putative NADH-flavin reductase